MNKLSVEILNVYVLYKYERFSTCQMSVLHVGKQKHVSRLLRNSVLFGRITVGEPMIWSLPPIAKVLQF